MNRLTAFLLHAGLLLSVVAAIGQLVLMTLDIFLMPGLRWYWGGAIAYFTAPLAFALTLRLLHDRPIEKRTDA